MLVASRAGQPSEIIKTPRASAQWLPIGNRSQCTGVAVDSQGLAARNWSTRPRACRSLPVSFPAYLLICSRVRLGADSTSLAATVPEAEITDPGPGAGGQANTAARFTAKVEHHPPRDDDTSAIATPPRKRQPLCYVVAGVSGSGKSTVGALLAQRLGCPFFEGDEFHTRENIAKMKSGQPLTDEDRGPWLQKLAALLQQHAEKGEACVVSCSALRRRYRDILSGHRDGASHTDRIAFPDKEELQRRTKAREAQGGHFMPSSLLESQLAALEPDSSAMVYREMRPEEIVDSVVQHRERVQSEQISQ